VENKKLSIQFTVGELQALVTLAEMQFFRQKFIDSKMPGYKPRLDDMRNAETAVLKISSALKKEKGFKQNEPQVSKTSAA
jgi:hypothetical protein